LFRRNRTSSIPSYLRTVDSFDDIPDATTVDADIDDAVRFVSARTLQPTPDDRFCRIASEALPKRVVRAAHIPGGRLMDGGGVVVADGSLVLESLWDHEHFDREYRAPSVVRAPARIEGTHASLISLWSNNYYHWLFDAATRLAVLEETGFGELPVIVPTRRAPWQSEILDRLGIAATRLTPFEGEHVQVDSLVWAAAPSYIAFPTPFVARWLRERLVGGGLVSGDRRLFIRRKTSRRIANEARVIEILARFGFEIVEPERMGVADQIDVFSRAEIVVAGHGAGIANAVFAGRFKLLELYQPGFFTTPYFALAGASDSEYWYISCDVAGRAAAGRSTKGNDLIVPLELLEATIEAMVADARL
jgi:hypothetical protein